MYARTEDSILVMTKDKERIVGIAMGLPIHASMEQVQQVFYEKKVPFDTCYYFADVFLIKEYRKKKLEFKMIKDFEYAITSLKTYEWIYFCEIVRATNDPRIPSSYRPLDLFWDNLGYLMIPNWTTYIEWLDIGDDEKMAHFIRFRRKNVRNNSTTLSTQTR